MPRNGVMYETDDKEYEFGLALEELEERVDIDINRENQRDGRQGKPSGTTYSVKNYGFRGVVFCKGRA